MISYATAVIILAFSLLFQTVAAWNGLLFLNVFVFFRPLLQPSGTLHYQLAGIPLSGFHAMLFCGIATVFFVFKKEFTLKNFSVILLIFFAFSSLPSFYHSENPVASLGGLLKIITSVSVFLYTYNVIRSKKDITLALGGLALSQVIPIFHGIYQKISGLRYDPYTGKFAAVSRMDSLFGDANDFGIFLAIMLVSTLMLLWQSKTARSRFFLICLIILNLSCSLLALNRGTWIALTLAFMAATIIHFRHLYKHLYWILLVVVMIGVLASPMIINRFSELGQHDEYGQKKDTFSGRINGWTQLLPYVKKHIWTGTGIESSSWVTRKCFGFNFVPHNDYLRILLEMGIISFVIYILFLSRFLFLTISCSNSFFNLWYINFGTTTLVIYFIIISAVQNPFYNLNNFPQLLAVFAIWDAVRVKKIGELSEES